MMLHHCAHSRTHSLTHVLTHSLTHAGVWQKRFFYLNNEFLIYKKEKKDKPKDIKGAIDLSEVDTVEVSPKGDLDVVSE